MLKPKTCEHLVDFQPTHQPKADFCETCVEQGDSWVHLRTCQQCGITLCCDSSPNQHASKHWRQHPDHTVIISAETGEKWAWCYQHKLGVPY